MDIRGSRLVLLATFLVMPLVIAPSASAQGGSDGGTAVKKAGPLPRLPDGKPDMTGSWNGSAGAIAHTNILEEHPGGFGINAGKSLIIDPADGVIPYQPWALTERNRRREDANGYEDPVGHCEFYDIGRLHPFGWSLQYSGNNVVLNQSQNITRIVDLTRRQHIPDGIRLWLGDSIGRWEGDTLVIETTNFNDKTRMGIGGDFHGPEAVLVERYTTVDANTINWTMTVTNPKVFTRPWTMTSGKPMTRVKAGENFDEEDICHEGNVDLAHLKNVYDQARGAPRPR